MTKRTSSEVLFGLGDILLDSRKVMNGRISVNEVGNLQASIDNLVSVSEASRRGVSWLAQQAESGQEKVILRNGKPVAAFVGLEILAAVKRAQVLEAELEQLSTLAGRLIGFVV